jgi:hypothetical protein
MSMPPFVRTAACRAAPEDSGTGTDGDEDAGLRR